MRHISGEPRIFQAPLRAPGPVTPVPRVTPGPQEQVAPATPAPPRAPQAPTPGKTGEAAWMAEIMFEAAFDPRTVHGHGAEPQGHEERGAGPGAFTRSELQGAFTGPPLGQIPRNVEEYRALLARHFDPMCEQACDDMEGEPVLGSMRQVWTPGQPDVNLHVAQEFMRYFLPKLGEAYDYRPCPVEFNDTLSGGYQGLYDLKQDRVYLPTKILAGTFPDFVDVLTHEQMHCMQERLIGRQTVSRKGQALEPEQRALAAYWRNEQPKYRSAMANGSEMSPETRTRYRAIGQEYHAIQTGSYMGQRLGHGPR